jgi:hypothetical protein
MAAAIELAACLRYTGTERLAGEMGRFGAIRPAIVDASAVPETPYRSGIY